MSKKQNRSFYYGSGVSVKIDDYLLRIFLTEEGYSQFQQTSERLGKKQFIKNADGILELQDSHSVKQWLRKYFESIDSSEFEKGGIWSGKNDEGIPKYTILSTLQRCPSSRLEGIMTQLDIHSQFGYKGTIKLNLFNDIDGVSHVRFLNGVVRVTKDEIELIDYSSIKNQGAVWESSIIPRDIKLDFSRGLYEKFCEGSMSYHNPEKKSDIWMGNYDLNEEQYLAMRTGYGYLLHTYNSPSVPKCIYFIDSDSELGRPQGGNGKSFVMKSIKHFKSTIMIDGKVFRKSMDSGGQFQFSMVQPDTTLCVIDDIRPEFDFDMLFSKITGEMQIERKGKDIFIIPEKDKPKFGVTTNYVISGTGTSFKRRQHIVEFGNYWSHCNDLNEKPSDKKHLGKELFSDQFTEEDWDQFFSYGFKCIQEYFKLGLKESPNQTHYNKTIKMEVEGYNGDGTITNWMEKWCQEDRVEQSYNKVGLREKDLYQKFIADNEEINLNTWNLKKFRQSFFTYIDLKPEYDYNPQFASRGKSLTDRRWQKGSMGKQENWIKIVDVNFQNESRVEPDPKEEKGQKDSKKEFFNSLKDEEVQKSDEDIDTLDLFKELANR